LRRKKGEGVSFHGKENAHIIRQKVYWGNREDRKNLSRKKKRKSQ